MNAKKETGYMFADITLAVNEVAEALGKKENLVNMANIDLSSGFPPVSGSMQNILCGTSKPTGRDSRDNRWHGRIPCCRGKGQRADKRKIQ